MINLSKIFRLSTKFEKNIYIQCKFGFARAGMRQKRTLEEALNQKKVILNYLFQLTKEIVEEVSETDTPPEREDFDVNVSPVAENKALSNKLNEESSIDSNGISNHFDKETRLFIKEKLLYKGHDPQPDKLVQRPEKDVVWGLGGELMRRKLRSQIDF